jgi:predicted nucleic acid-binding protein
MGQVKELAILDAGPMISAVDEDDEDHRAAVEAIADSRFHFLVPAMCIAEAAHIIERNLGPHVEAGYLAAMAGFEVVAPEPADFPRMAEIVRRYADFPLGGTDASIVALAERLDVRTIVTLDRRHFAAIRPRHCERFTILPG